MKIDIYDKELITKIIEVGSIRLECYLHEGKTVVIANALNGGDFIAIQPLAANKVAIKADKKLAI
jgi:hypothetical protein